MVMQTKRKIILLFLLTTIVLAAGCIGGGKHTQTSTTTHNQGHTFVIHPTTKQPSTTSNTWITDSTTRTGPTFTTTTSNENFGQTLPPGTPLSTVPIFISEDLSKLQRSIQFASSNFKDFQTDWIADEKYFENTNAIIAFNNNYILPYYLAPRNDYTLAFVMYDMPNGLEFTLWGAYDRGAFVLSLGNIIDFKYYVQELEKNGTVASIYFASVKDGKVVGVTKYMITDFLTPQYFGDEYSFTINYYYTDTNDTFITLNASASVLGTAFVLKKTMIGTDPDWKRTMIVNGRIVTDIEVFNGDTTSTTYEYNITSGKVYPEFILYGFVPLCMDQKTMVALIQDFDVFHVVTLTYNSKYYAVNTAGGDYSIKFTFYMTGIGTSFVDTVTLPTVTQTARKSTLDFSDVQTIMQYILSDNDYLLTSYLLANFGEVKEIIGSNSFVTTTNYGFGTYVLDVGIFNETVLPFFAHTTAKTYILTIHYPDGSVKDTTSVISYTPQNKPISYSFDAVVNGTHIVQSGVYYPQKYLISEVVVSNGHTITTEANFDDSLPDYMIPVYAILGAVRNDTEYIYAGVGIFNTLDIMILHGTLVNGLYVGELYDYYYGEMDFSLATGSFTLSISS